MMVRTVIMTMVMTMLVIEMVMMLVTMVIMQVTDLHLCVGPVPLLMWQRQSTPDCLSAD